MNIKDIRNSQIGVTRIWHRSDPADYLSNSFVLNYSDHAMKSFYFACDCMDGFENTQSDLALDSRYVIPALTFQFLCLEGYLNSILKILCLYKHLDFGVLEKKKVHEKYSEILKLYGYNNIDICRKYNHVNEIREMYAFRNELFHDRTFLAHKKYRHTNFATNILNANHYDLMQVFSISLNVINLFRYIIDGMDLMPNIVVHTSGTIYYTKFDQLYNELVIPWFGYCLKKHALESTLDVGVHSVPLLPASIIKKHEFEILMKVQPDVSDLRFEQNKIKTSFGVDLFEKIKQAQKIEPGKFGIGNYGVQK